MKEEMGTVTQKNSPINYIVISLRLIVYSILSLHIFEETGVATALTLLAMMIYIEVNASITSFLKTLSKEQMKIIDIIFRWNRQHECMHEGSKNLQKNSASGLMEKQ